MPFSRQPLALNTIKAVVFDLDNTLVSSSMDFTPIRQSIHCPPTQDILSFCDSLPASEKEIALQQIIQCEMNDAKQSYPLLGCHSLLYYLEIQQLFSAIVTRNCLPATTVKLKRNNINLTDVITREDFPAKPAPHALRYLAHKWQLQPFEILYVGDYLYDLQFAINAGMPSCLISYGKKNNFDHLASLIVTDLTQLQKQLMRVMQYRLRA